MCYYYIRYTKTRYNLIQLSVLNTLCNTQLCIDYLNICIAHLSTSIAHLCVPYLNTCIAYFIKCYLKNFKCIAYPITLTGSKLTSGESEFLKRTQHFERKNPLRKRFPIPLSISTLHREIRASSRRKSITKESKNSSAIQSRVLFVSPELSDTVEHFLGYDFQLAADSLS